MASVHQVICCIANSVSWKRVDMCTDHLWSKAYVKIKIILVDTLSEGKN